MFKLITILSNYYYQPVVPSEYQYGTTLKLDLNAPEWVDASQQSTEVLIDRTQSLLDQAGAQMAIGRYAEDRANLYARSPLFQTSQAELRSVHLGVDLTLPAQTPVFAPLAGELHSFADNANFGDYGPTIILQHELAGMTFYTLYGHLSCSSLHNLTIGKSYHAGEQLGVIGKVEENGCWPPHLHFQIIKDLEGFVGGYPGVVTPAEADRYLKNCPDPNLILKIST